MLLDELGVITVKHAGLLKSPTPSFLKILDVKSNRQVGRAPPANTMPGLQVAIPSTPKVIYCFHCFGILTCIESLFKVLIRYRFLQIRDGKHQLGKLLGAHTTIAIGGHRG